MDCNFSTSLMLFLGLAVFTSYVCAQLQPGANQPVNNDPNHIPGSSTIPPTTKIVTKLPTQPSTRLTTTRPFRSTTERITPKKAPGTEGVTFNFHHLLTQPTLYPRETGGETGGASSIHGYFMLSILLCLLAILLR